MTLIISETMPKLNRYSEHHIKNKLLDYCFHSPKGNLPKLIFVNIPKNASSSVRFALGLTEYTRYQDIPGRESYSSLCIIRNPLTRIVSSYNEVLKLRDDGPAKYTKSMDWYKNRRNPIKSFRLFLEEISNGNFYDIHTFPQKKALEDKQLDLDGIDDVILFEELSKKLPIISERYGVKPSLPKKMQGNKLKKTLLTTHIRNNQDIKEKILERDLLRRLCLISKS